MLGRPGHQRSTYPEQREVDGLGTRRDEGDLGARRAECLGGDVTCPIKRAVGGTSLSVRARRIAGRNAVKGFGDFGEDRRGPRVV